MPSASTVTGSPGDNYVEGFGTIVSPDTVGAWVPVGKGRFLLEISIGTTNTQVGLFRRNRRGLVTVRTVEGGRPLFFSYGAFSVPLLEEEGAEYQVQIGAPAAGSVEWRIVQDRR